MTPNRQTRIAEIIERLEAAGVQIENLASGAVRLYGRFGSVLLTCDLINLRQHELERLCNG